MPTRAQFIRSFASLFVGGFFGGFFAIGSVQAAPDAQAILAASDTVRNPGQPFLDRAIQKIAREMPQRQEHDPGEDDRGQREIEDPAMLHHARARSSARPCAARPARTIYAPSTNACEIVHKPNDLLGFLQSRSQG